MNSGMLANSLHLLKKSIKGLLDWCPDVSLYNTLQVWPQYSLAEGVGEVLAQDAGPPDSDPRSGWDAGAPPRVSYS